MDGVVGRSLVGFDRWAVGLGLRAFGLRPSPLGLGLLALGLAPWPLGFRRWALGLEP